MHLEEPLGLVIRTSCPIVSVLTGHFEKFDISPQISRKSYFFGFSNVEKYPKSLIHGQNWLKMTDFNISWQLVKFPEKCSPHSTPYEISSQSIVVF